MSVEDLPGLLRTVCERPEDDGARLIYADALDEVGQVGRAEFIRVQVELERLSAPCACDGCVYPDVGPMLSCKCTRCRLGSRSRKLLAAHGERWAMNELVRPCDLGKRYDAESGDMAEVDLIKRHWHRGFVARVECDTPTLMGRACGYCQDPSGHNVDSRFWTGVDCSHCNGTGRIPGIAAALGKSVPLTECVLTDKRPSSGASSRVYWGWYRQSAHSFDAQGRWPTGDQETLPDAIHDLLPKEWDDTGGLWTTTVSESAAQAALARAAANYCRQLAGLPAIGSQSKPCDNIYCENGRALEDHDGRAGYGTCPRCKGTGRIPILEPDTPPTDLFDFARRAGMSIPEAMMRRQLGIPEPAA